MNRYTMYFTHTGRPIIDPCTGKAQYVKDSSAADATFQAARLTQVYGCGVHAVATNVNQSHRAERSGELEWINSIVEGA